VYREPASPGRGERADGLFPVHQTLRTGKSDDNVFRRYLEATDQIPYLFGPEVETYLDQMRVHLADLQLGNDMMADTTSPDYQKGVQS
jgi:hypothetical protein